MAWQLTRGEAVDRGAVVVVSLGVSLGVLVVGDPVRRHGFGLWACDRELGFGSFCCCFALLCFA